MCILSIALGVGHKIVLIIPTPFSRFFYFHISIHFIFSICYSGPMERVNKEHFRICEILWLHSIKNLFQHWNVPKTCYCSTGNFLSSRFSPYLWSLERSYVTGNWGKFRVNNAILSVLMLFRHFLLLFILCFCYFHFFC